MGKESQHKVFLIKIKKANQERNMNDCWGNDKRKGSIIFVCVALVILINYIPKDISYVK